MDSKQIVEGMTRSDWTGQRKLKWSSGLEKRLESQEEKDSNINKVPTICHYIVTKASPVST